MSDKNENNERHHAAIEKLIARIAELEEENRQIRSHQACTKRAEGAEKRVLVLEAKNDRAWAERNHYVNILMERNTQLHEAEDELAEMTLKNDVATDNIGVLQAELREVTGQLKKAREHRAGAIVANGVLQDELAALRARRCEDCEDFYAEEPCDRFSPELRSFIRKVCYDKPLSCCFWTERGTP